MSAVVCGKRSYFEDATGGASSPPAPVSKKLRRFSSRRSSLVDQLRVVFPLMDLQLIEKVLEECGSDIDSAIKRLHELCLRPSAEIPGSTGGVETNEGKLTPNGHASQTAESAAKNILPADVAGWVEVLVREMMSATSVDDARARAARVLESLEKTVTAHTNAEAVEECHKENKILKEQIEALTRENAILKRAVAIQHERQKEYDNVNTEVELLKQAVCQYQEQVRTLEVNNYALAMHLKQAQQSSSMPGRFHPDVF